VVILQKRISEVYPLYRLSSLKQIAVTNIEPQSFWGESDYRLLNVCHFILVTDFYDNLAIKLLLIFRKKFND